jgi:hypothetical protein
VLQHQCLSADSRGSAASVVHSVTYIVYVQNIIVCEHVIVNVQAYHLAMYSNGSVMLLQYARECDLCVIAGIKTQAVG